MSEAKVERLPNGSIFISAGDGGDGVDGGDVNIVGGAGGPGGNGGDVSITGGTTVVQVASRAVDPKVDWPLVSELNWPEHLKNAVQRTRFLDDHKGEIPNETRGRRRYVDANAFHRYWSKQNKKSFESLESLDPKKDEGVIPDSVPTSQYLENVVPLYQKVFKGKHLRE